MAEEKRTLAQAETKPLAYKELARDMQYMLERVAFRKKTGRCIWCGGVGEHDEECELAAMVSIDLDTIKI